MKEEKFKVINFIRKLILNLDNLLDNFPKKDLELKNRIRQNSYDLLELVYEANVSSNIETDSLSFSYFLWKYYKVKVDKLIC